MPTLLPPTESEVCGTGATPNKGAAREAFRKWIKAYLNLFGTAGTTQGARATLGIKQLQVLDATVAASALTITLQPTNIDFRSTTLGSGAITNVDVPSTISCVIPSGATMGAVNAIANRLAVLAINNAGTVELAVVNVAGGVGLDESALITTVALSAASDSSNVVYSTTLRTGVAFRIVGYIESTQATAGTWATAPSLVQGTGGITPVTFDKARIYRNAAFSTAAASTQKVPFDSVDYDTNSTTVIASNRVTPKKAGYYSVKAVAQFSGNSVVAGDRIIGSIYKNGAEVARSTDATASTTNQPLSAFCSDVIYMNGTTDYLEFYIYASAVRALLAGSAGCYLTVTQQG